MSSKGQKHKGTINKHLGASDKNLVIIKVAIVDALAEVDLEPLRAPLESNATKKIIHNAVSGSVTAGTASAHEDVRGADCA